MSISTRSHSTTEVASSGVPQSRTTEARKIGNDDPMAAHQLRDSAGPFLREPSYPVQQDDGCAGTALEHGGRDSSSVEPAVRDRQAIQELREVLRGVLKILGASHLDIRPSPASCDCLPLRRKSATSRPESPTRIGSRRFILLAAP